MNGKAETPHSAMTSVTITNSLPTPLTLHLEPWCEEFTIPTKKTFRINFDAPNVQPIPIQYGERCITLEGWEGAIVQVWCDEEQLY